MTIGIVILIYSILDMIEDIIFLSNIKKLEKITTTKRQRHKIHLKRNKK